MAGISPCETRDFPIRDSRETSDSSCGEQRLVNPATGDEETLFCRNCEFGGREYSTLSKRDADISGEGPPSHHVPQGKVFLMSDDRFLHQDSRDYGSVPQASCRHIFFRLWGADGFADSSRRFNIIW